MRRVCFRRKTGSGRGNPLYILKNGLFISLSPLSIFFPHYSLFSHLRFTILKVPLPWRQMIKGEGGKVFDKNLPFVRGTQPFQVCGIDHRPHRKLIYLFFLDLFNEKKSHPASSLKNKAEIKINYSAV